MDGRSPLDKLRDLGYTADPAIAIFPPFLLDDISTYLTTACHPQDGIDLLAHYTSSGFRHGRRSRRALGVASLGAFVWYRGGGNRPNCCRPGRYLGSQLRRRACFSQGAVRGTASQRP
jgi:hypothetical protein